jgi:hypothetical protein
LEEISNILNRYQSISLSGMNAVPLTERTDTKFIFRRRQLSEILAMTSKDYRALVVENARIFPYHTLYFDTPDNRMYLDHHNGKLNRCKIRFREYLPAGLTYLEVKYKTNTYRTVKKRMETERTEYELSKHSASFIRENALFDPVQLIPKLTTKFHRITLASNHSEERVTIDFDLNFEHGSLKTGFPNLAVAEVKRNSLTGKSTFTGMMHHLKIYPEKLSKYCIGRVLTDNCLKYNNFKEIIVLINKLNNDPHYDNPGRQRA